MNRRLLTIFAFANAIVFSTSAYAQSAVEAGGTVRLHGYMIVDLDCKSAGDLNISMILDPKLGSLEIVKSLEHPKFVPTNPRYHCNEKLLPNTAVLYHAKKGVSGLDRLSYDVLYPTGRARRQSVWCRSSRQTWPQVDGKDFVL